MASIDDVEITDNELAIHMNKIRRQFKFGLGQLVYLMVHNKVHSAKVTSRTIIENALDEPSIVSPHTQPFGRSGVFYSVHSEEYEEHMLFASKAELLGSM